MSNEHDIFFDQSEKIEQCKSNTSLIKMYL